MSGPVVSAWRRVDGGGWRLLTRVAEWEEWSVAPRHLQAGPWSLRLPVSASALKITKRDLITFDFAKAPRFTGRIESIGPASDDTGHEFYELAGVDALAILGDAWIWPDPTSGLNQQNVVTYKDRGDAETVLRRLIQANVVDRLGLDMVLPASQSRGAEIRVNTKHKNLLAVVSRKCARAGLGVHVGLANRTSVDADLTCWFNQPQDASRRVRVTPRTGSVRSWRQNAVIPSATRAIVAAAQEETALKIGTVNVANNALTIAGKDNARHRLRTGSVIRFHGKGTPPAPLDEGKAYFAIRVDDNTFKVARTRSKAADNDPIGLTDAGSGNIQVTEETRIFRYVVDDGAEEKWGWPRETLVTSGIEDDDDEAVYVERGEEALADATGQSSFELEAVEPDGVRYGEHFGLGDLVAVELMPGAREVVPLGGVRITGSQDAPTTVHLIPGDPDSSDPLFRQAKILRALRQQVNGIESEAI